MSGTYFGQHTNYVFISSALETLYSVNANKAKFISVLDPQLSAIIR